MGSLSTTGYHSSLIWAIHAHIYNLKFFMKKGHKSHPLRFLFYVTLLRFSQTHELESSKAAFTIAFLAAGNRNYDPKQRTLKHRKHTKRTEINKSHITNHDLLILLRGPLRWLTAAKNANVSNTECLKRKCQLAFELQSSRVFEKRSNAMSHDQLPSCYLIFLCDQFFPWQ